MPTTVQQKQAEAIQRIAKNAEAAGITPDQLQKLLSGVSFETGLFGKLTPDEVKESFAGAALSLAQKQDAKLRELPPPKNPMELRTAAIEAATTGAAMLALVKGAFAGKDLAGLPSAAYSEARMTSGPSVDFKLLLEAVPQQLTIAEAKVFTAGLLDELIACARRGQMPLDVRVLASELTRFELAIGKRGFSAADIKELVAKGGELVKLLDNPDLRNADGKMAILELATKKDWEFLTNDYGWGRR